ncbi:FadR/GntR family transcriptional regulator [Geovibrio ferrireducens]|jgi:GntR family transcriptional repressor for pyruvate dehydrogenase complex|uniref:FadR/GntR family transcriptional regulator n=1 Tax=Geovibrio ferrireducens TaxID=46201 RepID=UPI002245ABC7|nr:FadR/GntR family transcriptional regulator [Geovibrio ferrireducens]
MRFHKIKPKRVSDEIYRQLKDLVLSGELKPGEKLPSERELAVQMGVSRPTLREALQKLEAHGFLKQIQGDGTYVQSAASPVLSQAFTEMLNKEDAMGDLMELRKILETWAARAAAERATDEEIEQLEEFLLEMEDSEKDYESDASFHALISYASHNVLIVHVMNTIYEWITKVTFEVRRHIRATGGTKEVDSLHRKIVDSIKSRNPEKAYEYMLEHMEYVEKQLESMNIKVPHI